MNAVFIFLAFFLFGGSACAQMEVLVGTQKTVSLSFPVAVAHIDLGSPEIDARLVGPGGRVVLVKGLSEHFKETNLTVVTASDEVYTFLIRHGASPHQDVIQVASKKVMPSEYAASIMDNSRRIQGVYSANDGLYAQVLGIYVRDSLLYFHLRVANATSLSFDLEAFRFIIQNTRVGKRTAQQEVALTPVAVHGSYQQVPSKDKAVMVVVVPRFTLSAKRRLKIELLERSGERHIRLKVPVRKLANAIVLPQLS